jgi:hypothetical protein
MNWKWLDPVLASRAAQQLHPTMELLRVGHAILSQDQFCTALFNKDIEVLALPHGCAALVQWGEMIEGKAFQILTVCGDIEHFETVYSLLEEAAISAGADIIMSVGRPGYSKLMKRRGYDVQPCILMKKVLHGQKSENTKRVEYSH